MSLKMDGVSRGGTNLVGELFRRKSMAFAVTVLCTLLSKHAVQGANTESGAAFFESEVFPILKANCFKCHGGGEKLRGGLWLTNREGILTGGDTGPAVNLENPSASFLLEMISYKDSEHEMPPKGKLAVREIEILTRWVQSGLTFDPSLEVAPQKVEGEHASLYDNTINENTKNYWAYRPVGNPNPPTAGDPGWNENPIDAYIHTKLAENGLPPSEPASKQQLIRRAYYDLIGLPPTPQQVQAFEADDSMDAFEKVIDDLLSSPHYGEKWARHWLDLVRFAETNGYERDGPKAEAWRYRDYLIRAFNQDKPYDRFIREQLAGDELDEVTIDSIIATGYQRLGIWDDEPVDADQAYYDGLDDVLSVTGQAFLGMTIGCARCHEHKIDPIPHEDYYRMLAFFHNTYRNIRQGQFKKSPYTLNTTRVIATDREREIHQRQVDELNRQVKDLKSKIETYEERVKAAFTNPEKEDAKNEETLQAIIRQKSKEVLTAKERRDFMAAKRDYDKRKRERVPQLAKALSVQENGRDAPETFVLIRGNAHAQGEKVEPGFPSILGFPDPEIPPLPEAVESSGRRRVLADWIASEENPLTARVMANRVWQFHFGRGLVRSSNNFGQNGDRPTHPDLLNWLARDLMNKGWSLKAFHKQIMLSKTYQMSSQANPAGLETDPNNDLIWRFDMRRLTAEELRDSILSVTGKLNLKVGGRSVYTEMPQEVLATSSRPNAAWGKTSPDDNARRSVYIYVKRSLHEPMLKAFDLADTDSSCAARFASTVPTQSLTMLNSKFLNDAAEHFADRLRTEAGNDIADQVTLGLSLAMGRNPNAGEISRGIQLIEEMKADLGLDEKLALDRFCLMALNLNEFSYLD